MLRLARRLTRRRDRITLRQGTAEALPLPDGSATVLWSIATVHHWSDLDCRARRNRSCARTRWPIRRDRTAISTGRDGPREPRLDRRAGRGIRGALPRRGLRSGPRRTPHHRTPHRARGDRAQTATQSFRLIAPVTARAGCERGRGARSLPAPTVRSLRRRCARRTCCR